MSTAAARAVLFISSYAPLTAIFALLFLRDKPLVAAINLAVTALGLLGLAGFLLGARRLAARQGAVASIHPRDDQVMSYIMSYLVTFLSIAFSDPRQLIALAAFFVILAYIYTNANMIHVNPTLNLLGYHLYEITLQDGETYNLIARGRVKRGATLTFVTIGADILLQKRG
jgi:hypothetical protein